METNDYQYFNPKVSGWAGFEFWSKLNAPSSKKPKATRTQRAAQKKEEGLVLRSKPVNKLKILERPDGRYPNALSQLGRKQDWLLPEDHGISLRRLTSLMNRPQTLVKHCGEEVLLNFNPLDEECLELREDPPPEPDYDANLHYATTSKTVDIRQLKTTMWNSLSKADKENQPTFMGVLKGLPLVLPDAEVESLSVHSCFITMLHLANEHSLALVPSGECDFAIQPKPVK